MAIDHPRYAETINSLMADPIIRDMANEIRKTEGSGLSKELDRIAPENDGQRQPTHEFTMAALHTYRDRRGGIPSHIGGPADAVIALLLTDAIGPPDSSSPAISSVEHLLEMAWVIIANAGWDGSAKSPDWQAAAERWRDAYHEYLGKLPPAEPAVQVHRVLDLTTER